MDLKTFLESRSKKEFAKLLGITTRALAYYANGERLTPLDTAHLIEKLSYRKVKTEDLEKIWRYKNG